MPLAMYVAEPPLSHEIRAKVNDLENDEKA